MFCVMVRLMAFPMQDCFYILVSTPIEIQDIPFSFVCEVSNLKFKEYYAAQSTINRNEGETGKEISLKV